jgi:hypothetical protein
MIPDLGLGMMSWCGLANRYVQELRAGVSRGKWNGAGNYKKTRAHAMKSQPKVGTEKKTCTDFTQTSLVASARNLQSKFRLTKLPNPPFITNLQPLFPV